MQLACCIVADCSCVVHSFLIAAFLVVTAHHQGGVPITRKRAGAIWHVRATTTPPPCSAGLHERRGDEGTGGERGRQSTA